MENKIIETGTDHTDKSIKKKRGRQRCIQVPLIPFLKKL